MNLKDVENLAELAKIDLNNEEKEKILTDMEGILSYVKQIEYIEVEDISIDYPYVNLFREDELEEVDFDKKLIFDQFPDSQDNFVKVKKIL